MYGGMLAFMVKGGDTPVGKEFAFDVAAKLQMVVRATSLGGTESLIEHR
jgi:cystathionine gamma-synthase